MGRGLIHLIPTLSHLMLARLPARTQHYATAAGVFREFYSRFLVYGKEPWRAEQRRRRRQDENISRALELLVRRPE